MPNTLAASISQEPERARNGSGAARTADRARRVDDADGNGAGAAFASLLEVTREQLGRTVRGTAFEKASAERMFEPPVADAHVRRRMAMKEDFRAASVDAADDRSAERAETKGRKTGEATAFQRDGSWQDGTARKRVAHEAAGSVRPSADKVEGDSVVRPGARPRAVENTMPVRDTGRHGANEPARPAGSGAPVAGRGVQTASSAPVASVGGSAQGSAPRDGNLAQQVGRALGVNRSGGAESVRSVESPTASSQAGNEGTASKTRGAPHGAGSGRESRSSEAGRAKADEPPRFAELIRSIRTQSGTRQSTARIQLEPPELGRMRVQVSLREDRLHVEVRTETAEATRLVNARAGELKAALALQGLHVEQFDVSQDGADVSGFRARDGAFANPDRRALGTEPHEGEGVVYGFRDEAELSDLRSLGEANIAFGRRLLDIRA